MLARDPSAIRPAPFGPPTPTPASHPTPPATPHPQQLGTAWDQLLASVGDKPFMSWVRQLTPIRADAQSLYIDTLPGNRDLRGFVDDRRLDQLATLLRPILGRPVRVRFVSGSDRNTLIEPETVPAPPPLDTQSASANRAATTGVPPRRSDRTDFEKALQLPLVKQVLAVFEATLVDARPEPPARSGTAADSTPRATHPGGGSDAPAPTTTADSLDTRPPTAIEVPFSDGPDVPEDPTDV